MKNINRYVILLIILVFVFAYFHYYESGKSKITINVAIFCDGIWENPGVNNVDLIEKLINMFEKKNNNIRVLCNVGLREKDYSEWLSQNIVNGKIPDIITILPNDFTTLSEIGVLKNLDDLIENDKSFDKNVIYSNVLMSGIYNNSYYALPREVDPVFMFVNETLLDKEGLSIPDNDWTWDDLLAICSKVTKDTNGDGKVDQFGIMDFTWKIAASTNSQSLFDENGKNANFDSQKMLQSVELVSKLSNMTNGMHPKESDLENGKVAFKPFQFSWYRTFKASPYKIFKYSNFNWKCIRLPKGPYGNNSGELNSYLMGINSKTSFPEESWEFLKFIVTDSEAQLEILTNSEGVSVIESINRDNSKRVLSSIDNSNALSLNDIDLEEVVQNSQLTPRFFLYSKCMEFADRELYKVINEGENIEDSLLKINDEINLILRQPDQ